MGSRERAAPLNAELRAAASRHGWQVVGGVTEAYRRHGICAGGRAWIRRPLESALGQLALTGTLHPNGDGHLATATPDRSGARGYDRRPAGCRSGPGPLARGIRALVVVILAAVAGAVLVLAVVGLVRLARRSGGS